MLYLLFELIDVKKSYFVSIYLDEIRCESLSNLKECSVERINLDYLLFYSISTFFIYFKPRCSANFTIPKAVNKLFALIMI